MSRGRVERSHYRKSTAQFWDKKLKNDLLYKATRSSRILFEDKPQGISRNIGNELKERLNCGIKRLHFDPRLLRDPKLNQPRQQRTCEGRKCCWEIYAIGERTNWRLNQWIGELKLNQLLEALRSGQAKSIRSAVVRYMKEQSWTMEQEVEVVWWNRSATNRALINGRIPRQIGEELDP